MAQTLRNAIRAGRVAHAYLFTGTRGVGKTSMARLFARALNCPDTLPDAPKPEGAGPDASLEDSLAIGVGGKGREGREGSGGSGGSGGVEYPPQDVQERMATAIMRGDDLNVIEIDGASNNSVDQARQLIASAGLSPTMDAPYKVYIIDEVHMLSGAAFNALLKTMEEPPSHVKFILCTTEPHKVPATIQSRCQRFEFRNIPSSLIAAHLREVLEQEGVEADDAAVWQVARLGNGSMRDALSLLDRLLATGESPITGKTLEDMLGLPARELVAGLVDALAAGDPAATLRAAGELLNQGVSGDQLVEVLIERLRQLMLIAACGLDGEGADLIELPEDERDAAAKQAANFDAAGLVHMIALLENLQRHAKGSANPRAMLDATLVRLALAERMADVTALLAGGGGGGGGEGGVGGKKG